MQLMVGERECLAHNYVILVKICAELMIDDSP